MIHKQKHATIADTDFLRREMGQDNERPKHLRPISERDAFRMLSRHIIQYTEKRYINEWRIQVIAFGDFTGMVISHNWKTKVISHELWGHDALNSNCPCSHCTR